MSWDDAVDGVDRETPGDRMPRALQVSLRLRNAANDEFDDDAPPYAELHCLSDFSFLRGAADAETLFARARLCGYQALAITDECSLAGVVRAHVAAKEHGIKLIAGSELALDGEARGVRRKAQVSPSPQPSPARGEGGTSPPPFQGEGWGGGAAAGVPKRAKPTPIPAFPLDEGEGATS